jgi:hypothetical protein
MQKKLLTLIKQTESDKNLILNFDPTREINKRMHARTHTVTRRHHHHHHHHHHPSPVQP